MGRKRSMSRGSRSPWFNLRPIYRQSVAVAFCDRQIAPPHFAGRRTGHPGAVASCRARLSVEAPCRALSFRLGIRNVEGVQACCGNPAIGGSVSVDRHPRHRSMKILLIEDDRDTADYVAQGLTEEGHNVAVSGDGRDGLFKAVGENWDLIIVDRM